MKVFPRFVRAVQRFNTLASGEQYRMGAKPERGSVQRNAVQLWPDPQFGRAGVRADWADSL